MKSLALVLLMVLIFLSSSMFSQNVKFRLKGLDKQSGVIRVAIYTNEDDFNAETTELLYSFEKNRIVSGQMEISIDLTPGTYGIAFLDDNNKDAVMNYNLIGIPKEGYAFSRVQDYGYSRPSFAETILEVSEGNNSFEILFNYF